jgi:hypothetical protein
MLFAMRLNKTRLASVCLALSTVCCLLAQDAPTHVAVVVTDVEGAVVAHAQVRFTAGSNSVVEAATDKLGQLTVELEPGSYTLSISSPGFERYTRQVGVVPVKEEQIFSAALRVLDLGGVMVSGPSPEGLELVSKDHAALTLKLADLKAMPQLTVTVHNPHTDADEAYSGVRVADLLTKVDAPLGKELRGEAMADYVIATGSDGYKAVLALGEVDPSFHPGDVIVADAMDGKPLDAHNGPLKLVVSEDKRPARCVRNLVRIELRSAP